MPKKHKRVVLKSKTIKQFLEKLHQKFVFVPTDKASNNIAVVCKKFYIEKSMKELGIFADASQNEKDDRTYEMVDKDVKSIVDRHMRYMKSNSITTEIPEYLPFLYWIPKMHKKPFSKQRYIAASHRCSTKPLSAILTKCLSLIEKEHRTICHRYEYNHGINPMWIIRNSSAVHKTVATLNRKKGCNNIRTYDFSTLYTSIPHKQFKIRLKCVIQDAVRYLIVNSSVCTILELDGLTNLEKTHLHLIVVKLFDY